MDGITIIRRSHENTRDKTGLGVYADKIERGLDERNIPYEEMVVDINTRKGNKEALLNGIVRPFQRIFSGNRSSKVFHATDEISSLYFPFLKGKRITTFHHVPLDKEISILNFIWKLSAIIAIRFSHKMVAVSPQTKEQLMKRYNVPEDRIEVIFPEVDPMFKTLDDVPREKTIGCVGRLTERKNVSDAIVAFSILIKMPGAEDYRMKICGKGPELNSLKELVKNLDLEGKVDFISDLSESEMVELYNTISVLANPSMHEGLGLATLEAQKCSAPVVFFKNAAIPEEVTRYAIPSATIEEFAKNMYSMIVDVDSRERIVKDAKEYADNFGKDFMECLLHLYDEVRK